jgi:hypothetical protein
VVTRCAFVQMVLLAVLVCGEVGHAQEAPAPQQLTPPGQPVVTVSTTVTRCVQPAPLEPLKDYNGPFDKTVGVFARKLDRGAANPLHYEPGLTLCSLNVKNKFFLFLRNTSDPVTFMAAGFVAGIGQATNQDPTFGQGAAGYGKRFGTDFLDQASFNFFKQFAYPSIFKEDPRYYRQIHGSARSRIWHAVNHSVVAYRYNGGRMFNFPEWLGTSSAVALGNLYHPGNERGFTPAATQVGIIVIEDIGFNMLREFWPEIARKLNLPFDTEPVPINSGANPVIR